MTFTNEEPRLIDELYDALYGETTSPEAKNWQDGVASILSQLKIEQERKLRGLHEVVEAAGGEMSISVRLK